MGNRVADNHNLGVRTKFNWVGNWSWSERWEGVGWMRVVQMLIESAPRRDFRRTYRFIGSLLAEIIVGVRVVVSVSVVEVDVAGFLASWWEPAGLYRRLSAVLGSDRCGLRTFTIVALSSPPPPMRQLKQVASSESFLHPFSLSG